MSFRLTDTELRELTDRKRPSAQAKVLTALGIPFRYHPIDGGLIVSTAAAEAVLGGPATNRTVLDGTGIDIEAMRRRRRAKEEKRNAL